jgi:hypothetical protein
MSTGLLRIAVLLGLCLVCGCRKQAPVAAIPPPAVPAARPVPHDQKLPEPPAPQTSLPGPITESTIAAPAPAVIPPPPPDPAKKPKKTPARKTPPAPVQTAKVEPAPPVPSPGPVESAPKLEQLLSPGEEQSYNQTIDQDLQRARKNLKSVQTKALSDSQKDVVTQVESFIKQAEDLRKTDLVEAKGLSHKADILSSDLARSLQ